MSRKNRINILNKLIYDEFINLYFEGEYPNKLYSIHIISNSPLVIKVSSKFDDWSWLIYNNIEYENIFNELKIKMYRKHLAVFKIQQWWKKILYDPKNILCHNFFNNKYNSYNHL